MRLPSTFLALTLLLWLGSYALRSYVPAAVWNLADELPISLKPVLAVVVNVIAIAGLAFFRASGRRALLVLTCAFGLTSVARQAFNAVDAVGPWLALVNWILFVWALGACARYVAARQEERWLPPAFACACALQVGMQGAWHGLDLHAVNGWMPLAGMVALSTLLCRAMARLPSGEHSIQNRAAVAWLLLGPALFLATTLAANVGRVSELTGAGWPWAALLVQVMLIAGAGLAGRAIPYVLRLLLIISAIAAAWYVVRLRGAWTLLVPVLLIVLVLGMSNLVERRTRWSALVSIAVGMALFFALLFGFYSVYEFTPLWPLALVPFVIAVALPLRARPIDARLLVLPTGVALLLTALYLIPPAQRPAQAGADGEIVVLTYNIHQGHDDDGVFGMPGIADEIAAAAPDLVALQEAGRGWTLLGGNDLIAYLRWRFPDYEIVFQPINGQLWGNAIMSRLPLSVATAGTFEAEPGVFRYGWIQAMIQLPDRHLEFYSVHLTSDLESGGGDPRQPQAEKLAEQLRGAPLVIVGGDFNALPDDAPMRTLRASLTDLGAQAGVAAAATWPAGAPTQRIDYILGRGARAVSGAVLPTVASDHRPVLVRVRLDNATTADGASSNLRSKPPGEP